jgi:hypothetical protein
MNTRLRGAGAASSEARNAALRGGNRGPDPVRFASCFKTGVRLGHPRGCDCKLREAIGAALSSPVEP